MVFFCVVRNTLTLCDVFIWFNKDFTGTLVVEGGLRNDVSRW